jgi:predicted nucleotide-binding protein (sugar kinase/HSP70/actin superfamily)
MESLSAAHADDGPRSSIRIGLPRTLYNLGYEPLWTSFLSRLGFTVLPSSGSRAALEKGGGLVNSDFCAPIVAAHGHFLELAGGGADFIFSPAVTSEEEPGGSGKTSFREKTADAYYCYYSQYLPTIVGNLPSLPLQNRLISPLVSFSSQSVPEIADRIHAEMSSRIPSLTPVEVRESFVRSWDAFREAGKIWSGGFSAAGRTDGSGPLRIALFGRPYVAFDTALSLGIPRKLESMGCEVWWMEEFDPDDIVHGMFAERMHWHYGRRMIALADFVAREPNLYPVFLSCFRCSPDSFLISYVKDIMERFGKPLLVLQLDAHGSDVGYTTRIEAGIASFENHRGKTRGKKAAGQTGAPQAATRARNDSLNAGDTVLLPRLFDEITSSLWDACFHKAGYGTRRVEATAAGLNAGYRFASGGECMPLVSIVGSAVETVKAKGLDPRSCYLFLPTLCMACNFPQFPIFADMAFRAAGLKGLKVGLVNTMNPGAVLPQTLSIRMLESNIAGSVLSKLACRVRPYETNPGQTDGVLREAGKILAAAVAEGADLRRALGGVVSRFREIPRDESRGRKPRIGLLGDLYAKYNDLVNQGIQALVERLGGELVLSSPTEYPFHFYDADVRLHGDDPRHLRLLRSIEQRYEKPAEDLIGDLAEPDFTECVRLSEEHGIGHYIVGETSINVGRALYYASHGLVDAILHVNPMFCCPGVVTASIYRKIQEDFGLPIVDIFYDGTGSPNGILIPHLHYLREKLGAGR